MKIADDTLPMIDGGTVAKEIPAVSMTTTAKREQPMQPLDSQPMTGSPQPAPAPTPATTWPKENVRKEIIFWGGCAVGLAQFIFVIVSFFKRK